MTRTLDGGLDALRRAMAGVVIGPADDGYDGARAVWNGEIDRRPVGGSRSARFCVFVVALGTEAGELVAGRSWVRGFVDALAPVAAGGGYVNAMAGSSPGLVAATYGHDKLGRLARIKGVYDPGNVFHRNVNITPA